jgi:hypothetical protein
LNLRFRYARQAPCTRHVLAILGQKCQFPVWYNPCVTYETTRKTKYGRSRGKKSGN